MNKLKARKCICSATFAIVLCCGAQTWSEATSTPSKTEHGPDIFCAKSRFNFGDQYETEMVKHTFTIENRGNETLKIGRIRPACYCTRAIMDKTSLAPGETSDVLVEMTLKDRSGFQNKSVRVESNDPTEPNLLLYLEGSVLSDLEISPRHVYFTRATPDSVLTTSVDVVTSRSIEITSVVSTVDFIVTELKTIETAKQYQIIAKTKPPLTLGSNRGNVSIFRSDGQQTSLPLTVMVVGPLSIAPQELMLVAGRDRPVTRYIIIRPGTIEEFSILSVELPDDRMTSVVLPLGGGGYRIQLDHVPSDEQLDGKHVVIRTDAEELPVIKIPITVTSDRGE